MRCPVERDAMELDRPAREGGNPGSDDNASRRHRLTIGQEETKGVARPFDAGHSAWVEIGDDLVCKPLSVGNEAIEWDWLPDLIATRPLVGIKRQCMRRIGDV
jgi:hypothetical protein